MAIMDKLNTFCTATAVYNAGTTEVAFGDVIDFTATYGPGGGDQPMWACIAITADNTLSVGSCTYYTIRFYNDADGTLPTSSNLIAAFTLAAASWTAGSVFYLPLGQGVASRWLRYVGITGQATTAVFTTPPTVTVGLVPNPQTALQ